jgi:hypothetical protein
MNNKADAIIQNIGAAAEASALFYNTLAKQVPSHVALELTKQYIAVVFQPNHPAQLRIPHSVLQSAIQRAAEDVRKKQEEEQEKHRDDPKASEEEM